MSSAPFDFMVSGQAQSFRRQQTGDRRGQPAQASRSFNATNSSGLPSSRYTDSWIDISSRPSSSSLSSANDEIITHGLRVQTRNHANNTHRRRRPPFHLPLDNARPPSAGDSSQEEYDESESESDRVMTSSNEALSAGHTSERDSMPSDADVADEDDEDENATALGIGTNKENVFTPQPNAFSHPPSSQRGSYFSQRPSSSRPTSQRPSLSSQPHRTSNPEAHDAALRASPSHLLSCAAAARNFPKDKEHKSAKSSASPPSRAQNTARVEPSSLRMISASELNRRQGGSSTSRTSTSPSPVRSMTSSEKGKRKAGSARSTSKERRAAKRLKASTGAVAVHEAISPTLLTWVVSAGVLVLVSALSFSAGYSVGKEAGRMEVGLEGGVGQGQCGRQSRSSLGLRKRLLSGAARVVTI